MNDQPCFARLTLLTACMTGCFLGCNSFTWIVQSCGQLRCGKVGNGVRFAETSSSAGGSDWQERFKQLESLKERQVQDSVVDALFLVELEETSLTEIYPIGQSQLPLPTSPGQSVKQPVLMLTDTKDPPSPSSSMALPLAGMNQLQLISFAMAKRPLSKSVMLQLNTLLINRDNALFDNLPWIQWSVDPQLRNRDVAGNAIAAKYHLGKRDAYNRFMGKDWQGRSLAIGNLALRLKYMLENESEIEAMEDTTQPEMDQGSLARRILELEIRDLQMDVAGIESEVAISKNQIADSDDKDLKGLQEKKNAAIKKLEDAQDKMDGIISASKGQPSAVDDVLSRVAAWTTNDGDNAAPYRGANGYAPKLDSKIDIENSGLPYTSPYELLQEILEDQLNAKVIGCVLENTSLLRGNLALGGAVVLQRIVATETASVMGQELKVQNAEEDFGNKGIGGGETMVVECDADEAVGVALAFGVSLKVDASIFSRAAILSQPNEQQIKNSTHIMDTLPLWTCLDGGTSLQIEGNPPNASNPSPISIPRTTAGLAGQLSSSETPSNSALFPTDNPIKTIEQFDSLQNEDKAKTLLESSNFQGRLPRPRVVKTSEVNPLDELLIPLIDESVRRELRIRLAIEKNDTALVEELAAEKSKYQMSKEFASNARENGLDKFAEEWENEAELLQSLRADVTQDEGSYSRFLDKDDWYERDRLATAKRVKRSSFGSLLDGIE